MTLPRRYVRGIQQALSDGLTLRRRTKDHQQARLYQEIVVELARVGAIRLRVAAPKLTGVPSYPAYCSKCDSNLDTWAKRHKCIEESHPIIWGVLKVGEHLARDAWSAS